MPIRGIGTDEVVPRGGFITRLCAYTLATYTAAGTTVPADGDLVTFSNGANNRVVRAPDNTVKLLGRVKGAPNTTDLTLAVEWLDVYAFVEVPVAVLANVTLGNSLIKNGDTTTAADWDATTTSGNIIAIAKSAATGVGTACGAIQMA